MKKLWEYRASSMMSRISRAFSRQAVNLAWIILSIRAWHTLVLMVVCGIAVPAVADDQPDADWPKFAKVPLLKSSTDDSELTRLRKERQNSARAELRARNFEFLEGRGTHDFLYDAADRLLASRIDLCEKPADALPIREQHIEWTKFVEAILKRQYEAGGLPAKLYARARYVRLDAQIEYLRQKERDKKQ